VRLLRLSPAARSRHHLAVLSLISLFAISVLLCSIHCVLPAQASQASGHHHHGTGTDQDQNHKLCGILCSGAILSVLPSLLPIGLLFASLAVVLAAHIRGRDKWLFWVQPRAPPL
jgi:hypothetical protein